MEFFFNETIASRFTKQGLGDFASLWDLKLEWFEPVNERRNGWSGVARHTLLGDQPLQFFIKRQQNHNTRQLIHPIRGVPTFRREYHNIQMFRSYGIHTLTPLYYGERRVDGNDQAILITRALNGYENLFDWYYNAVISQPEEAINAVLAVIAQVVRKLHDQGIAHYCLYPNHIFVRTPDAKISGQDQDIEIIRLIDLEKARRFSLPFSYIRRFKDLECFMRHARCFSFTHIRYLLDCYFGDDMVPSGQRLHRKMLKALVAQQAERLSFYQD
ncbi:MAG: hypothetical protein KAG53_03070 [Endozoicomonadaceae bacterium]|nr:hypothetical protein [Endozoicomonadaceae bacterium]